MFAPVSWNGPGARVLTVVMRISGHTLFGRPVPPVPNRNWSAAGNPGSPPGRLRIAGAGGFCTPARVGEGSLEYNDLLADLMVVENFPAFGDDGDGRCFAASEICSAA